MKNRRKLLIILATITFVIICGLLIVNKIYKDAMAGMMDLPILLAESTSPAGLGKAAFLKEYGFTDSSISCYVFDPVKGPQPIWIGGPYATDSNIKLLKAVWSKDGTIIAIRARVDSIELFVDAYDFQAHRAIAKHSKADNPYQGTESAADIIQKSKVALRLLVHHGGSGQSALSQPGEFPSSHEISAEEAKVFEQ